jgi:small subunit ribosomal protein S15
MLDKDTKDKIIKKFKIHEQDTGSAEVQIAILTEEIKRLTEHLQGHKKDFSSRRGLIRKVGQRRRLLKFLQRENIKAFDDLTKKLKIKVKISAVAQTLPEIIEEAGVEEHVVEPAA